MYDFKVKEKIERSHRRAFHEQIEDISSAFLHLTFYLRVKNRISSFYEKRIDTAEH